MALNFLVLGAGYVGQYLHRNLPNCKMLIGHIYSENDLEYLLKEQYPSHILINCAGKTGRPNVDWCEDHKAETFGGNVGLPVMIAEVCQKLKRYWIHIGSGCIYSGYEKHWSEEDIANFTGSFYSKTKCWSQEILEEYAEALVLRIRMPIDEKLSDRCYIFKVVKYAKEGKHLLVKKNSMTTLKLLCEAIKFLAEKGCTGTFNVVNKGAMDVEEILRMYQLIEPVEYITAPAEEVLAGLKAGRSNCILSTEKIEALGFNVPLLENEIFEILKNIKSEKM